MIIELKPMTAEDLVAVQPWFDDPHARRFLGGPDWPARELALAETVVGTTFRVRSKRAATAGSRSTPLIPSATSTAARVTGGRSAMTGERPTFVRSVIDRPAASIALAVDPARRGTGIGRAMLRAVLERAEVRDVQPFGAGVEPDNVASVRCFEAAGFVRQSLAPDWEGMLYFIRAR